MSDAAVFLETVYGNKPEGSYILLWEKLDRKISYWFRDWKDAARLAETRRVNLYSGVNLSPKDFGPTQRCKIADILAQVALFADLDIAGEAHKSQQLPTSIAEARLILPPELKPSILTHSGHGLQAWWLFKEPTLFETDEDRLRADDLSQRWFRVMERRAAGKGWKLDAVYDLARVLRVPGTINRKEGVPDAEAHILELTDARYNPSDILEFLEYREPEPMKQQAALRARKLVPPKPGSFVYDPNAKADPEVFRTLCAIHPKFLETWRKVRTDLAGRSQSQWDLALANILWDANLSDQQIADALIHFRRLHGGREHNNPYNYLERTLAAARDRNSMPVAAEPLPPIAADTPLDRVAELMEATARHAKAAKEAAAAPEPKPLPEDPAERLNTLNATLQVRIAGKPLLITEIRWIRGTDPRWRITMEDGQIVTLSHPSHIRDYNTMCNDFFGQLNATLAIPNKKADWVRNGVPLFQSCVIEESAGENNDLKGDMRDLLERYLRSQTILPGPLACWENAEWIYFACVHNERIAIHAGGVLAYFQKCGERLNKGDVINGLSALGAESKRMNGPRGKSQNRYYLPEEWSADEYTPEKRK